MVPATRPTRPVQVLNDAIQALEAAALVCYATPKKKPVHQVRTWTRRIEAQLELIALLPYAPAADKQRGNALRILKKLRRAAGTVRDLDVQRDLLAQEAARARGSSSSVRDLRKEARKLRRELKQQREHEAATLQSLLKGQRKRLPLALQTLREGLAPIKEAALPEPELLARVRDWHARSNLQDSSKIEQDDTLHTIRKRAKLARYMVEPAPQSSPQSALQPSSGAQRLAARFEVLQQAGGEWHDLLQLGKVSAKRLGKSSQLAQHFVERSDKARRAFKRRLAQPVSS